jgi:hypothetical protein
MNQAIILTRYKSRRFEAWGKLQQARKIFSDLKLDQMVKLCREKIYTFNQVIPTE